MVRGAKRRHCAALAAAALVTLSAACSEPEYGVTVPAGARSGDLVWSPCEVYLVGDDRSYPGDCGTLVVPENRNDPSSRLIPLPVTRIQATGEGPSTPIFWLEGGPGGPNINVYPTDGLLERHDFVMVGYRGVQGQVVLECPETGDAARAVMDDFLSEAALASLGRATSACAQRLLAEGIDLDGYSMNQTIDDMEAARIAMGYDRIDLFGNSYGTRLEMIYQWRYPSSLNRVVMVAVNPPGHFVWDPADTEDLLERYAELCAVDASCSARTSDLVATMKEVSASMPTRWMGIPINPVAIRLITFFSLMESMQVDGEPVPLNAPAAIDMWLDAAEGDASGMAMASFLSLYFVPGLLERGHFVAMGASAPDYLDPTRDYRAELTSTNSVIGAPFSLLVWSLVQGWPATSDQSFGEVQNSDVETLLVSGSLDGSTPLRYARDELLPHTTNTQHVIMRGQGHTETFWHSQPEARARLLNTFFDSGRVDDSLYEFQAPVFDVDKSWGRLARVMLAGSVISLAAVALLISWMYRRRSSATEE